MKSLKHFSLVSILKLKIKLSCLFLLLLAQQVVGQCPTDTILYFTSQAEVDAFLVDYPNCTEYQGDISIYKSTGTNVTNLQGLHNLVSIEGSVFLRQNGNLVDLTGLENLNHIGGYLSIEVNVSLINLHGLENLNTIGGNLFISQNYELSSLSGLDNLSSIGGFLRIQKNHALANLSGLGNLNTVGESLQIYDNNTIANVDGLDNLSSIGDLSILENAGLTNLNGLANLSIIEGSIWISYNPALTNLDGLENLTSLQGWLQISYNDALTNLSGLENLTSVGAYVQVTDNATMTSLNGLDNLTSVGGHLGIRKNYLITNLDGLGNLITVGGPLYITYNDMLSNIDGLGNLISIGGFLSIHNNSALTDINGLGNLDSMNGYIFITGNDAMVSLSGLKNLTLVNGYLHISDNDALTSLNGLDNLTSIEGYLHISDNDAITSLSGLENLMFIGGDELSIFDNPNLSLCTIPPICQFLLENPTGNVSVMNNAIGCANIDEVVSTNCTNIGRVNIYCFYDINENGQQESNESNLPNASVNIFPGGITLYNNASTGGVKYLNYGDYLIHLNEDNIPNWIPTVGELSYAVHLDAVNPYDTLNFGLNPSNLFTNLSANCVNHLPRCNQFVIFEPMAINNGTTVGSGTLWFTLAEEVLDVNFIDMPDTTDGADRFGWFFTDLYPQQVFKKQISVQLPGPPVIGPGDILTFEIEVQFSDQLNTNVSTINAHRVEVQCSFDPNDKLVQSNNPYNYSLTGEDLIYTIRFQNTGNAEAYDVVIKDLLSEDLDLSTFRFIASSHESVLSTYLNDRMLTFEFRDIFLPDSTTNFEASQGYVMYGIRALDTLADFSTIENTAHIFFDYNPAVITNTTENIMVESFDMDGDGFEFWVDCDDNPATGGTVNPNALEIPYNDLDEDCNEMTPDDDLDGDGFVLADDCDDNNALVNPAALEIPNNDIDEDCDGEDLLISTNDILTIQPQILPNPTSGILQIHFPQTVQGSCQIRDLTCQLILENVLEQQTSVDVSDLPSGVYILLVQTGEGLWTERVVKL